MTNNPPHPQSRHRLNDVDGKPSGKVELLIITQMSPFFDKRSSKAERRTSWLYLASPFTLQRLEVFVYIPNY